MKLAAAIVALGFGLVLSGAASATTFAAISYNKETGAYGFSKGYSSRDGAEERAAQECGPGCETVIWTRDACVALATAGDHAYGSGWDTDQESADQTAMNNCSKYASDCSVVAEACSAE
jgi:basic membrane lipoprotein Med (substrate-binding protein (PBP1-ABC) superfamily)